MGKYGEITEDFYTERTRILDAISDEPYRDIIMRLIGALAFRTHCEKYGYIQDRLGRVFTDFDFASYPRFTRSIIKVLTELGYEEDKQVTQLFGDRRMLFHDPVFERHIDVFYNVLDFCHPINFVGRLEIEKWTLPLAELLLEKMQIVQINEKDLIDTTMLLREHPIGSQDDEIINGARIARILGNDWGFWRTVTGNLEVLDQRLEQYKDLADDDRQVVHARIVQLQDMIAAEPKTFKWKTRARIGERVKWYKSVEELER
ncbi:MAG TPA: hypothetical protein VMT91_09350 [Anaerolineales bacterium]|nr:hypothetical protein [Anaerolineales bacterium]